jgi:glutathione S-transferase
MLRLVIGNKNYSSWSLRAWLHLRESGISFEEIRIALFSPGFREALARYTAAGRVPVLLDGDLSVWDSLAIALHVHEQHGGLGFPEEPAARAMALSITAEMHAGFLAIRDELPQNLRARRALSSEVLSAACRAQIARVDTLWSTARRLHGGGGPWLFGELGIADVFYVPVALRFATYEIALGPESRGFVDAVQGLVSVQEFVAAARAETEHLDFIDDLVDRASTPLVPG